MAISLVHGLSRLYVTDHLLAYVRALLAASEPLKALVVLAPENLPPQVDEAAVAKVRSDIVASVAHIASFEAFQTRHPTFGVRMLTDVNGTMLPRAIVTRQVVQERCGRSAGQPVQLLSIGPGDGSLERVLLVENPTLHVTLADLHGELPILERLLTAEFPGRVTTKYVTGWFDWTTPETANSYDLVLCNEVLEHVPDPEATVWHAVHDVLRGGGSLLVSTPSALAWVEEGTIQETGYRHHVHQLSPQRLFQAFAAAGLLDTVVHYLPDMTLYATGTKPTDAG